MNPVAEVAKALGEGALQGVAGVIAAAKPAPSVVAVRAARKAGRTVEQRADLIGDLTTDYWNLALGKPTRRAKARMYGIQAELLILHAEVDREARTLAWGQPRVIEPGPSPWDTTP